MTDNVTHRQKNKTTKELTEDVKKLADTNKGLQEKVEQLEIQLKDAIGKIYTTEFMVKELSQNRHLRR